MSIATRDETVDLLRKSGLIDERRLGSLLSGSLADAADGPEILARLAAADLLTPWQVERLGRGKWRGFLLGKYRLINPLGAGGMGTVYLAEHQVMRHRVAIKVLAKHLTLRPGNVDRFEREARAAAVVNHPNIVRAYDIDRAEGNIHYLVMEFVVGKDLHKLVSESEHKAIDARSAAEYIRQAAVGLHAAHKAGMIHRDVKPSNLLLDETGTVKLLDLGLARIVDDDAPSLTMMHDSKLIGTVDFLAPEQALNCHAIDHRADIYSLGCTLYYLLTGSIPFPKGSLTERILKHQTRRPVAIAKRCGERSIAAPPQELVAICEKMMAKSAERRYATALDVAEALRDFLDATDPAKVSQATAKPNQLIAPARSAPLSPVAGQAEEELTLAEEDVFPAAVESNSARGSASSAKSPVVNTLSQAKSHLGGPSGLDDVLEPLPGSSDPLAGLGSSLGGVFDDVFALAPETSLQGTMVDREASSTVKMEPATPSATPLSPSETLLARIRNEIQIGERDETGHINYPLWFLIGAGLLMGLIVVWLGFSWRDSTRENVDSEKIEKRSHEGE